MATLTITGQSATETVTQSASMSDADFANVLAAYKGIFGHPELSDQEAFAKLCDALFAQIIEQSYAAMKAQAAANAAASVQPPVIVPSA